MDAIQQKIALMAKNRKQINDSVAMLKTIGTAKWQPLYEHLPTRWKNIVKELAADG